MSDDLANRVSNVDQMLQLLDYLPAEEPADNLVQRTMRRIEEARSHPRAAPGRAVAPGSAAGQGAGLSQGLHRSPGEDAATS